MAHTEIKRKNSLSVPYSSGPRPQLVRGIYVLEGSLIDLTGRALKTVLLNPYGSRTESRIKAKILPVIAGDDITYFATVGMNLVDNQSGPISNVFLLPKKLRPLFRMNLKRIRYALS